jgi:hypothetical protein
MLTTSLGVRTNNNNDSPSWDEVEDLLPGADELPHPDDREDES